MDEAIECLQTEANLLRAQGFHKRESAAQLGVEALKRLRASRKIVDIPYTRPLPGEIIIPIPDTRRPDPRYPGILLLDK